MTTSDRQISLRDQSVRLIAPAIILVWLLGELVVLTVQFRELSWGARQQATGTAISVAAHLEAPIWSAARHAGPKNPDLAAALDRVTTLPDVRVVALVDLKGQRIWSTPEHGEFELISEEFNEIDEVLRLLKHPVLFWDSSGRNALRAAAAVGSPPREFVVVELDLNPRTTALMQTVQHSLLRGAVLLIIALLVSVHLARRLRRDAEQILAAVGGQPQTGTVATREAEEILQVLREL